MKNGIMELKPENEGASLRIRRPNWGVVRMRFGNSTPSKAAGARASWPKSAGMPRTPYGSRRRMRVGHGEALGVRRLPPLWRMGGTTGETGLASKKSAKGTPRNLPKALEVGIAAWLLLAAVSAGAQTATIDWYRVANGGGVSSGNGCTLMGTIGQAEPGFMQAAKVALYEGFWSAYAVLPPKIISWNSNLGGNWNNPANWDLNVVPGPGDEVHITTGATVRLDADTAIGSLFLSNLSGLSGPGKLTLTGPLHWAQGTISGTVQCNGGTMGGVPGDDINLTGGQLINTGYMKVTLLAGSGFYTGSGSVISNLAGGTFDFVTDKGTIFGGAPRGVIYNAGLFRKSAGTGISPITDTFNNLATGTVEGDRGTLSLQAGGLNSGTNAANAGGALDFGGGTHSLDANCWLTGGGVISCSGGTVNFIGASTSTGTVLVNAGTFNFNNMTPASVGAVTITWGTLGGSGRVAATGPLAWTGGTISGAVQCNGGSVGGGEDTYLTGGQLINTGYLKVMTPMAGSGFYTGSGSVISNLAGGTFDLVTDKGTILGGLPRGVIYNVGLFRKSAGTGTSPITDTFNNLATGTVEGDSGILSLQAGGLNSGANTGSAGGTLDFGGGTHTLDAHSWLAGAGVISCSGGTANFIGASAATEMVLVNGGTFNFNNLTPVSVGAVTVTWGTLGGSGRVAATGPLAWTGGTISGALQCNGGTVGGSEDTYLTGGQLINTGFLKVAPMAGTGFYTGSASVISNLAGGTFDLVTDKGTSLQGVPRGTIYNAGLFRKSAGTGTATITDNFNNIAAVETWSGILEFTQPCVQNAGQTRLLGGNLMTDSGFLLNGGRLEGTNTVVGNVANQAIVAPGGTASAGRLTINGNYTETGAAVLQIELGGATPASGFDQLSISGTATLAGTLAVSLINSFVPANHSAYNFLTAGSRTGVFSATNYPSSLAGVAVSYAASGASLIASNTLAAQPVLTIRLLPANSVSLSWPSSAAGFHLEATSNLAPSGWAPVNQTPADDGATKSLIVPVSSSTPMFYRLHKEP